MPFCPMCGNEIKAGNFAEAMAMLDQKIKG